MKRTSLRLDSKKSKKQKRSEKEKRDKYLKERSELQFNKTEGGYWDVSRGAAAEIPTRVEKPTGFDLNDFLSEVKQAIQRRKILLD